MACHRAQEEDKRSVGTPCTSAPSTDSTQPWPQEEPAAANVTQRCCFQGCPNVMPHSQSQTHRICPDHRRVPRVVAADGSVWRYCLQCTKAHTIDEFSGDRRSCQASLLLRRQRSKREREAEDQDWSGSEGGVEKRQRQQGSSGSKARRQPATGTRQAGPEQRPALEPSRSVSPPHAGSPPPPPKVVVLYMPSQQQVPQAWPAQAVPQPSRVNLPADDVSSLPEEEAVLLKGLGALGQGPTSAELLCIARELGLLGSLDQQQQLLPAQLPWQPAAPALAQPPHMPPAQGVLLPPIWPALHMPLPLQHWAW